MRRLAAAAFVLAWFCWFAWDSLLVRFAPDDLMNLRLYWSQSPLELFTSLFAPWRGSYRPMAALYYLPLLRWFGLNPFPYHVVTMAIVLASVYLVYRLARALGCGEAEAGVAALFGCYQAALSNILWDTAFIFDALCCFFYLAAVLYYARIRGGGRRPGFAQTAGFLALFLAALDSKEMAVTLPAVLLAYEFLFQKDARRAVPALASAALLDAAYLFGKLFGPGALVHNPGYTPELSLARVRDFQVASWSDFALVWNRFGWHTVAVVWIVLALVAWRSNRPVLRFCWFWLLVTPLPIEFLYERTGACLAIPYCGLAIFAAVVLVGLARRLPSRAAAVGLCAAVIALWGWHNHRVKVAYVKPAMLETGDLTWRVISQLRAMNPRAHAGNTVVFLNDPFDGWDMLFIAELYFREPSLQIKLGRKTPMTSQELAKADCIFDYQNGRLVRLR